MTALGITVSAAACPRPHTAAAVPRLIAHTFVNSSVTATTPPIDTTGANLIVIVQSQYVNSPIAAISDSKGNSYIPLRAATGTVPYLRFLYNPAPTAGAGHTFTKTLTGNDYGTMLIMAFSTPVPYVAQTGAVGTSATGTTLAAGSVTPPVGNALVIAGLCNSGSALPYTINGGFAVTDSVGTVGGSWEGGAAAYLVQTNAAAANPAWSWTTASESAATIAVFAPTPPALTYPAALTANGLTAWRTVLFDDFVSAATINPTANRTSLSPGVNWYVASAINNNQVAGTNYNVLTTTTAGQISNGQINPAGNNASPAGGIFQVFGDPSMAYGQNWQSTLPSPNDGTGGIYKYFYAEAYIQLNGPNVRTQQNTLSRPAWWTLTPRYQENADGNSDHYELDIMEFSDGQYWTYHNWTPNDATLASNNDHLTVNSEWHTFGLLWFGNGTTGQVSVWYDNVLQPESVKTTGGAGSQLPWFDQSSGLYVILGMSSTGLTFPMNVDWVRIWTV